MQIGYNSLNRELKTLPRLLHKSDSDVQDTTSIVRVLFSVNRKIKTSAYWPWISKLSLFYRNKLPVAIDCFKITAILHEF